MTSVPIVDTTRCIAPTNEHIYLRTHRISGRRLRFRLFGEDGALRQQAALSTTGRAGRTLVKEGALRITQVALRKGSPLGSHQIGCAASIHVLRGQLRLATSDGDLVLEQGDLVALDVGVFHAGVAMSDCVVLVTMAMQHAALES